MLLLLLLVGCGSDAVPLPDGVAECDFDKGVDDLWRLSHGVPPDVNQVPAPGGGWLPYFDDDFPLLSFLYPPDWTVTKGWDGVTVSALVTRDDGDASMWIAYVVYPRGDLTSEEVVDHESDVLTGGDATEECFDQGRVEDIAGQEATVRVLANDDTIFYVNASSIYDIGNFGYPVGTTLQVAINEFVAPDREFKKVTEDVFLPILYQFFRTGGDDVDSDGDGVYDSNDDYPYDPDRS